VVAGKAGAEEEEEEALSSGRWEWRGDVWEWLKKRGGVEKLTREKPSTVLIHAILTRIHTISTLVNAISTLVNATFNADLTPF